MKIKRILAAVSAFAVMGVSALNVNADVIETDDIFQFVSIEEDVFTPFEYDLTRDTVQVYNEAESNLEEDDTIYIEDDSVIVVFKKECSELNKAWTANDFNCSNIASVEDLTYLDFTEEEKVEYLSQVTFRQMLKINLIEGGKDKVAEVMDIISQRDDVKKVEPNVVTRLENDVNTLEVLDENTESNFNTSSRTATATTYSSSSAIEQHSNDPYMPYGSNGTAEYNWIYENTQLYDAWETYTTGSSTVKVGVMEEGIDSIADLASNLTTGLNHAGVGSHGTAVASVIGAKGNNGIGVAGVNWNVSIVPLTYLDSNGNVQYDEIYKKIQYANNNEIPILNMSFLLNDTSSLAESIENYYGLVVCAAGNDGVNIDTTNYAYGYPSKYDLRNIISVAGCDKNDNIASGSCYGGTSVDLAAPYHYVCARNDGTYSLVTGTSVSTPFVSGVAALLLAYKPELTTMQLKEAILNSVDVKSSLNGKVSTSGRINAYKALKYVEESDYRQIVCQVSSRNSTVNLFKDYFTYDSDIVAYKGFKTWNSLLANNLDIVYENNVNSTNAGLLSVNYSGSSLAANQKLYTLKFEVNLTAHNDISNPLSSLEFYAQISSGGPCYWAMLGDVNNDGNINNTDLTRISNYVSGSYSPTNTQKVAMDVNMDGTVNLYDMITLQNYINGTINSF